MFQTVPKSPLSGDLRRLGSEKRALLVALERSEDAVARIAEARPDVGVLVVHAYSWPVKSTGTPSKEGSSSRMIFWTRPV